MIPFDPQPAKDTAWQRFLIRLGLSRRNARDERQQAAADENAIWHAAEAERRARQPGREVA